MSLPYFVGMWVRKGAEQGIIKKVEDTYLIIKMDDGKTVSVSLVNPSGWEYFTTVWEEGKWLPFETF